MMSTSGLSSRIHAFDFSNPANTLFHYGSSVLPLSIAAPMAGTCDEPIPATILATAYFRFADLDLLDFDLGLGFSFGPAFGMVVFFAVGAPAMNFDGTFFPERERLPSTERPPPSIILA